MGSQVLDLISNFGAPNESSATGLTYTTLYGDKRTFSVIPERLGEFFDSLAEIIKQDIEEETVEHVTDYKEFGLPIAEMIGSKQTIPVTIHLKMSFNTQDEKHADVINDEFITKLVYNIQSTVAAHLNISPNMSELLTTVETSNPWDIQPSIKGVSVRVMFPYAQVDVNFQRTHLRAFILDRLHTSQVLTELPFPPIEAIDQIVQPIKDYIPMYRCKETELEAPMIMSHIYQRLTFENISENNSINLISSPNVDMGSIFMPTYYQYIFNNILSKDFLNKNTDVRHWFLMFTSIYYWSGTTSISKEETTNSALAEGEIEYDENVATTKNPLTIAIYLLNMLHIDRFNVEPFWKDVGQALFNITEGSQEGFNLFVHHSAKSTVPGRDRVACLNYYKSIKRNQLSEKTIAFFARKDSRRAYDEWHGQWSKPYIYKALSCDHDDVAELIYRIFWLEHMCTDKEANVWHVFKNHRLMVQDGCVELELGISEYLVPMLEKMKSTSALQTQTSGEEKKQQEIFNTQIGKLCKNLKQSGFVFSCIRMARKKFKVYDFNKYKDSDPSKTGWYNCVITCSGDHAYTSDGKPEDYITKSTYMTYRSDFTWQHPLVVKFLNWMGQVFPNKELCHYFLKDMASFLYGRNAEKLLRAWSGQGDNSKTMVAKLLQLVLGAYCVDFPPSMLTGKSLGSSGPSPELAQAEGAHVGFVPETEHDEKIREGTVKRFTGGDRFFARFCKQDGGSLEAFFKIIIMCNTIPEFTAISKALRNRFLYIPFLATWTDDAPDDPAEQYRQRKFKKNIYFENELPELAQAAAWVMVQYYSIYKKEGLKAPPIVVQYTEDHWNENDPILGFITEYVTQAWTVNPENGERITDNSKYFTASEAHVQFTKWHRRTYPNVEVPSQPMFRQDLSVRLGPQGKSKRWYGMELIKNTFQAGSNGNSLGLPS